MSTAKVQAREAYGHKNPGPAPSNTPPSSNIAEIKKPPSLIEVNGSTVTTEAKTILNALISTRLKTLSTASFRS